MPPRRRLALVILLAGTALAAGACGSSHSSSPPDHSSSRDFASVAGSSAKEAAGLPAAVPARRPSATGSQAAAAPDVIETGTLDVRVHSLAQVRQDTTAVTALAGAEGGYVQSSRVVTGHHATATMTVRVPDAALAHTVATISALGTVTTRSEAGRDVTGQVVDLAAEQTNLESEETAVRGILSRATKVSDILDIQQELFSLQGQIQELAAQRKSLANQVTYASLAVTLSAAAPAAPARAGTLSRVGSLAADHTVDALRAIALAIGWAAPAIVVAGLAVIGFALVRRRRRSPQAEA